MLGLNIQIQKNWIVPDLFLMIYEQMSERIQIEFNYTSSKNTLTLEVIF